MSHSFAKIWIHAVWSTKNRIHLIDAELKPVLYENMQREFAEKGCEVKILNGMPDHVHCLFLLNPSYAVADVVKHVKGHSSHFVNMHDLSTGKFAWQTGYSAFSVSSSVLRKVYDYIRYQEKHHQKNTVQDELDALERLHRNEFQGRSPL
jgi:putative transposase